MQVLSPGVNRVLAFGVLLFGVGLSLWGVGYIRNAFASSKWPTTNGVIDWADVRESRDVDDDTWTYTVRAVYRYEVDETGYVSDRVRFGIMTRSSFYRERMPEEMKRYAAGKEITVYYKPDNPEVAVLEPGVGLDTFLFLFLGLIVAFVGALGAFTTPFQVGREPLPPLSRFRPSIRRGRP